MNRGLVRLDQILPGVGFFEPEPPKEIRAPNPKPPKVIGDPTREPVNRQAALIIAPAHWLHKPLPPEPAPVNELERLRAENATLKATNTNIVAENSALRKRNERLNTLLAARTPKTVVKAVEAVVENPKPSRKQELLERLNHGS